MPGSRFQARAANFVAPTCHRRHGNVRAQYFDHLFAWIAGASCASAIRAMSLCPRDPSQALGMAPHNMPMNADLRMNSKGIMQTGDGSILLACGHPVRRTRDSNRSRRRKPPTGPQHGAKTISGSWVFQTGSRSIAAAVAFTAAYAVPTPNPNFRYHGAEVQVSLAAHLRSTQEKSGDQSGDEKLRSISEAENRHSKWFCL